MFRSNWKLTFLFLTDNQKKMIPILIEAGNIMNELFWYEAYGDKNEILSKASDADLLQFININYGPWDRLDGNAPFVEGVGEKPAGANYYPADMTKEEFEAADLAGKNELYNFIRRDKNGKLITVPYHQQFSEEVKKVSDLLRKAAALAENAGLKKYLELRADALLDDNYQPSDLCPG